MTVFETETMAELCIKQGLVSEIFHSGNLAKLEEFFPVLRQPLTYFFREYSVDYVVLDQAYTSAERLGVAGCLTLLNRYGDVSVYSVATREPLRTDKDRAAVLQ